MKDAGMRMARVSTEEARSDAISFYEATGFDDVGRVRWWGLPDKKGLPSVKTATQSADINF
jgi:hypothetical protein